MCAGAALTARAVWSFSDIVLTSLTVDPFWGGLSAENARAGIMIEQPMKKLRRFGRVMAILLDESELPLMDLTERNRES
jgi:hypothetical protein